MTSHTVLVPQYSTVYSPVIGVQFTVGVKHLCHLPFLLLLRDPGLPAGLPAGLEATEEGQDLGLDSIFISYYELFR